MNLSSKQQIDDIVDVHPTTKYAFNFDDPRTHEFMLQNVAKYAAFSAALQAACSGKSVLEIGAGSGILSLICVAHGATEVIAIERPIMAEIFKKVLIEFPGATNRITIVADDAFNVLPKAFWSADIILSETVGYCGFDEDIGRLLYLGRSSAGTGETICIPSAIKLGFTLGRCEQTHPHLSVCNSRNSLERVTITEWYHLGERFSDAITMDAILYAGDTVINAVDVFLIMNLVQEVSFTNIGCPYWPHACIPLGEDLRLSSGQPVQVKLEMHPSNGSYRIVLHVDTGQIRVKREIWSTMFRNDASLRPKVPVDIVSSVRRVLCHLGLYQKLV